MLLHNMKITHWISSHDEKSRPTSGTSSAEATTRSTNPASEETILDLEREAFLSLCGEPKTQRASVHALNNKP